MPTLRDRFDAEMTKQGRDVSRDARGNYVDYASAVMWSWAQWGAKQVAP